MTAGPLDRAARALAESRNVYSIEQPDGRDDRCVTSMDFDAEGLPLTIHFSGTWDECQAWIDREQARAVLAALDPPSPAMVEAGAKAWRIIPPAEQTAGAVWTAMLAAAREGE